MPSACMPKRIRTKAFALYEGPTLRDLEAQEAKEECHADKIEVPRAPWYDNTGAG